jgi:predicted nucleotidyltransferase
MTIAVEHVRAFLAAREQRRQRDLDQRFDRAWHDFRAILELLRERYQPTRIYQWGSLLDRSRFNEHSDIDVATEGITDPAVWSQLVDRADELTQLPLDMVALERIEPEFAELIRMKGRVVYAR